MSYTNNEFSNNCCQKYEKRLKIQDEKIENQDLEIQKLKDFFQQISKKEFDTEIIRNTEFSKEHRLKIAGHKLLATCSIHGLPRIFRTEKFLIKLIWILSILISSSFGIATIINTTKEYLKYDVVTLTERKEDIPVTFPQITFCAVESSNIDILEVMVYCDFAGEICNKETEFENFRIFNSNSSLNCIRYNGYINSSTEFKVAPGIDYLNGLQIGFQLPSLHQNILVFITDHYLNSYSNRASLLLIPYDIYNIYIKKSENKRLQAPYNPCVKMTDKTYLQENCIDKCVHEKVLTKYNCTLLGFYMKKEIDKECDFIEKKRKLFERGCKESCPRECDSTTFDFTVTANRLKYLNFTNNTILFYIYFSDLSYMEITQIPQMTRSAFTSSIGGSLALFIGVRFLSIIEILEFLIESFCILVS